MAISTEKPQPTYEELQERVKKLERTIRFALGYCHGNAILPLSIREILMDGLRG